jgi:FkbM family methyltransferase
MADPFRNLRLFWHRARDTQRVTLDGVTVNTDAGQARLVRYALFKRKYEGPERQLVARELRKGDTVLEIGAGIGFVGLLAARLVAPGRVVSFEANPALEGVIAAKHALNAAKPELRMQAITLDGAPVTFHASDNVVSSSLFKRAETQREITVESVAMADALQDIQPDVLVMDVEGAEIDLLSTGDLAPIRAAIVELHPHVVSEDRIDALLKSLAERGFEVAERLENNVLLRRTGAA